jgi:hypothetical protein
MLEKRVYTEGSFFQKHARPDSLFKRASSVRSEKSPLWV